ncbi:MAG: dTMP kinase [Clostridiales bacterium]|nr:dTMP kinase [Clostridiales bacterium]
MKYKAVIFDLDGTLTDSAPGILEGVVYALTQMGRPLPDQSTMRRFLGPPLMVSFTSFLGMTEDEASQAQDIYRDFYLEQAALNNSVYPGVRALLQALKRQGAYLGVATHKPLKPSLHILEHFGLLPYFDEVAGPAHGEEVGKGELIRRALRGQQMDAVMIGDRATDITGAQEAGVDGIAALYGYGHLEEFERAGCQHYAPQVSDLYALLGVQPLPKQGYFISFEGNDGSGKSTQARLLAERLRQSGYEVLLTREPGGTKVGEQIREMLLKRENTDIEHLTEALLYAAARAQHVREVIEPALNLGKLVISDRYVDSSIAYQGAGRGLGEELVRAINAPAIAGRLPDTTVFLRLDPEEGMGRAMRKREADRLEAAGDQFHRDVAAAFDRMISAEPRFLTISSKGEKAQTAQAVYGQVSARLRAAGLP